MKVSLGDLAKRLNDLIANYPECEKMYITDIDCSFHSAFDVNFKPSERLKKLDIYAYPDDGQLGIVLNMEDIGKI